MACSRTFQYALSFLTVCAAQLQNQACLAAYIVPNLSPTPRSNTIAMESSHMRRHTAILPRIQ